MSIHKKDNNEIEEVTRLQPISETEQDSESESKLIKALNAPALNGGFDLLLKKVGTIEEIQHSLVSKIDDVYEAIYNPDKGLFSRIKANRTDREKDIIELQSWRKSINKDLLLDAEDDKELKRKVDNHELTIVELKHHRDKVSAIIKWMLVALGGGGVSLFFQWLSTLVN